jgi:4-hydroxy-tetrahydrodipicolinate reductase
MSARAAPGPVCAVLVGASGRMGRAILVAAAEFPDLAWVGAIASKHSAVLGRDAGVTAGLSPNHLLITADVARVLPRAHVVIDFSDGAATGANLSACRIARKPLLIGTTGFAAGLEAEFTAAAREIPLLIAPNTSLGVTLLVQLAGAAARLLPGFALRITETHHREKRDAPSGTALALAAALRQVRVGIGAAAAPAAIPIDSAREGQVVGEHTVTLCGPGEELFLGHRALDRAIFARGALAAALWLASQPSGRYGMADLLAVKTVT